MTGQKLLVRRVRRSGERRAENGVAEVGVLRFSARRPGGEGVEAFQDGVQGFEVEVGIRIEPSQTRRNPGQRGGVFRKVPQGDAGPGGYAEELIEWVVESEHVCFNQLGEQSPGEWFGQRADLDETVEVMAVADLGGWVLLRMQVGTGGMVRLQPVMRGSAQAAVPPGMRCRFMATVR